LAGLGLADRLGNLPNVNSDRIATYAMLVFLGLGLGLAQGRSMALYLRKATLWLPATLVGYLLAGVVGTASVLPEPPGAWLWHQVGLFAAMGALIGLAQGWALRDIFCSPAWWILASAIGFLSYVWLVILPAHSTAEFVFVGTLLAAAAASVTGLVLTRLQPRPLNAVP
jgi:hypothetical protein